MAVAAATIVHQPESDKGLKRLLLVLVILLLLTMATLAGIWFWVLPSQGEANTPPQVLEGAVEDSHGAP